MIRDRLGGSRLRKLGGLFAMSLVALSASAGVQVRTYNPVVQKYIAGFGSNPWGTDLICGVQLDSDCYGHWQAYVRETTPGGKAICASLMAAKAQQQSVTIHVDTTNSGQCEIVRVES